MLGKDLPVEKFRDLQKSMYMEYCATFFEKITDNVCMNVKHDADWGQWCYVSSKCKTLGKTGTQINSLTSWKMCQPGKDDRTRDKSVKQLIEWGTERDLMLALLMKLSYPTVAGRDWEDVKQFFMQGGDDIDLTAFPEDLRVGVKDLMVSGHTVVFGSKSKHPPHGIFNGDELFESTVNHANAVNKSFWEQWEHPLAMTTITQLKGRAQ